MTVTAESLLALKIADVTQTYTEKEVILYALGIGLGQDPMDVSQLVYVYEKAGLKTLPTLPAVLAYSRISDMNLGLNYLKMVHGEQSVQIHKLPPVKGTVTARTRVEGVTDKGADKGAVVLITRELFDDTSGDHLATLAMTVFARGNGGIGSAGKAAPASHAIPEREPDAVITLKTLPQAALIYRLSGDINPLHADPAVAKAAGFPRPILHGLATYGVMGHAVMAGMCGYDSARIKSLVGRFSGPVYPGEEIAVSLWKDAEKISVRASVPARDAIVFTNGLAELTAA